MLAGTGGWADEPKGFEDADANSKVFGELSFAQLSAATPNGRERHWCPEQESGSGVVGPVNCRITSSRTDLPRLIGSKVLISRGYAQNR